jgi:hypothetical protein
MQLSAFAYHRNHCRANVAAFNCWYKNYSVSCLRKSDYYIDHISSVHQMLHAGISNKILMPVEKKPNNNTNEDRSNLMDKDQLKQYAGDEEDNASAKEQSRNYIDDLEGKDNKTDNGSSEREAG